MGFAIGGAIIAGGLLSSNASQNAASTQAAASNHAADIQQAMFNQQEQDQAPWRAAGQQALGNLTSQLPDLTRSFTNADFQQDPGYQFQLQQGQQAIDRAAAAHGGFSGGTIKSLLGYSQGLASQDYQNAYSRFTNNQANTYNRLAGVAGIGQAANAQLGAAGQNYANQTGNLLTGSANAQAAGMMGSANAINSAIGTGTNTWMQSQMMNNLFGKNGNTNGLAGYGSAGTNVVGQELGSYNYGGD